ncbi:S49 family peptidase [Marinivivus vitaminiproducens]|uniref:S49 family peptidase n=1 Tax=Marinivivus vitaminiproducens TaxID=3035935 RepID=UPI0027998AD9|nr:S49 family peptidase [Geminicoccaceae bacterium SCSIO 64248]
MKTKLRSWIGRLPYVGRERPPVVPVIRLHGTIGAAGGPLQRGRSLSAQGLASAIDRAFALKQAKAVALSINSPGGSAVQSALIARHIRRKAEEKDKTVLAFIEDVGASGGYWLACAGDEIFADRASIVGSIGVITAGFGFVEAIRKLGVERRVYTAGEEKALLDPFQPEDEDGIARLRAIQQDAHDAFRDMVRERRKDRLKAPEAELFDGRVFSGKRGLAVGLVDAIGSMDDVLRDRYGAKVRMPVVNASKTWWPRRLLGGTGEATALRALDAVLDGLEERALWARYGL